MSSLSEYAEFTEALAARRERLAAIVRRSEPALADASELVDSAVADLGAATEELRSQNEALFAARLELESNAAHLRELFELAPTAYFVTTVSGCIQQANSLACTLLGRPLNALVGKPLACYVELTERRPFREAMLRCALSQGVEEWPIRFVPRGDVAVECRVRVRALRDAVGDVRGLAWVATETLPDPLDF